MTEKIAIRPQEWFQMKFLSCPADIVVGGGKAGAGKTFAILMDPLRYLTTVPWFGGVIFRRETPQITNEWGLRDTAMGFYPFAWGDPKRHDLSREFGNGNKIKFTHLEQEKDIFKRQGTNVPFIGFDELTHFTKKQFFYLLSRNRSTCGVRPYIRATCNPDPDSWVKELIEWRVDPETGYIIKERDGVIRYFTVDNSNIVRGDTREEVVKKCPHIFTPEVLAKGEVEDLVKSFTFIEWDIYENMALLEKDPAYLANLLAQDEEEKNKLLDGNWNISIDNSCIYEHHALEDLFSNFVEESENYYITCDVARFGRDLAVIFLRKGWRCSAIRIRTKSAMTTLHESIEQLRAEHKVQKSRVLIDQDWIGGGLVDMGGYVGFSGWSSVLEDPTTKIKENYANLKTQCYYRTAYRTNEGKVTISLDNVQVDGVRRDYVVVGGKTYKIKDLLKKQLRAIKRKNADKDGKKQINGKEEQKNLLSGMSPDLADTFMMREYFELTKRRNKILFIKGK